jgi:hypothetical protein
VSIGDTLSALMVINPDGSRTVFAQKTFMGWMPFVFAERAVLDRCIGKVRSCLNEMKGQNGVTFEVCTYTVSERRPLD